jgi:hypothetical protein
MRWCLRASVVVVLGVAACWRSAEPLPPASRPHAATIDAAVSAGPALIDAAVADLAPIVGRAGFDSVIVRADNVQGTVSLVLAGGTDNGVDKAWRVVFYDAHGTGISDACTIVRVAPSITACRVVNPRAVTQRVRLEP